jgi:hypothetical protein
VQHALVVAADVEQRAEEAALGCEEVR